MARIGLLGGSFNPAHKAHRRISLAAMQALGLDEVWWLVSPGNPLKDAARDMAPFEVRLFSAQQQARRSPIRVSDFEQREGTRFTVDTVGLLKRATRSTSLFGCSEATHCQIFTNGAIGGGLSREVPIAVIPRPGYDSAAHAARAMGWLRRFCPAFGPGAKLDGVECTGDPAASPAARPHVRNRHPGAPPQLAPPNPEPRLARSAPRASHCHQGDLLTERPAENGARTAPSAVDVEGLHRLVLQSLDDDQALEVVTIPLAGKSNIADHMVVASGRSTRQVASMAVKLADKIKERFGKIVRIEGLPAADWVLIDAGRRESFHIFRPEVRSFYNLERMWAFGDSDSSLAARG
jgi:ribosome silencing factor RsfS/YbeB/iojap